MTESTITNLLMATAGMLALTACGDSRDATEVPTTAGDEGTTTGGTMMDTGDDDEDTGEKLDLAGGSDDGEPLPTSCGGDLAECELIDVLFVVDNSGTMDEEQINLSCNFAQLIERLENLEKPDGGGTINADVNIMVTTSDFGHPLCTDFQPEGYEPSQGQPVYTGCNARIDAFTSVHPFNPVEIPEACTEGCPTDVVPGGDPFIHFDSTTSNVAMGDVSGALSCVAPQGINGCGYEAPLETMLHALRPEACWNDPKSEACEDDEDWGWVGRGFIRRGSTLAIAIVTDEADDGVYEACESKDNPVLHPTARYKDFLAYLEAELDVEVVMLGVPPVTAHSDQPPYEPTEGGVFALEYRDWKDGVYDGTPEGGDIPPVRIREVCESLNETDDDGNTKTRCCIESICDDDFSPAVDCLTGIIQDAVTPVG